ncbi:MAG: MBL fold metallo-hydrolase [Corynebacterium sp.]|nr:MBL fold metallo-hydrolase [Corynebacterium sp.]
MKLTILGCSGSVPAVGNPASGYLVTFDNAPSIVMDLGSGTLSALQELQDPCEAHLIFSHLHADHCSDFPSLLVWRRFHPEQPARSRNFLMGPKDAPIHLGRMSADEITKVDDFADTFAFSPWVHGEKQLIDDVYVTPYTATHPIEAYALRMEHINSGKTLCYTGDSAYTENLVEAARGVDVLFAEAAWGPAEEPSLPDMHMTGFEAGRLAQRAGAKKLVLVHIQPWGDKEATLTAAQSEFSGEVVLGAPGMTFDFLSR